MEPESSQQSVACSNHQSYQSSPLPPLLFFFSRSAATLYFQLWLRLLRGVFPERFSPIRATWPAHHTLPFFTRVNFLCASQITASLTTQFPPNIPGLFCKIQRKTCLDCCWLRYLFNKIRSQILPEVLWVRGRQGASSRPQQHYGLGRVWVWCDTVSQYPKRQTMEQHLRDCRFRRRLLSSSLYSNILLQILFQTVIR